LALLSFAEIPQLQAFGMSVQRLLKAQPVFAVVTDQHLVVCWQRRESWCWRLGHWAPDSCRDGVPLLREAMGELLADLLFESDVLGAEILLVLPEATCDWRVLEGVSLSRLEQVPDRSRLLSELTWSIDPDATALALSPCGDAVLALGAARQTVQAWIDVVEIADLPLRRMDWCLSAALRALNRLCSEWAGDLAWLLASRRGLRLVLIRAGVPELDRCVSFEVDDPLAAWEELVQVIDAWQRINSAAPLGWWLSLPVAERDGWAGRCIQARGDTRLDHEIPGAPLAWDPLDSSELDPVVELVLFALRGERA
jgi:hypothetical protein